MTYCHEEHPISETALIDALRDHALLSARFDDDCHIILDREDRIRLAEILRAAA